MIGLLLGLGLSVAGAVIAAFGVLSSGGSSYSTSRTVLSSDGTAYNVPQAVLNAAGSSYTAI